MDKNDFVRIVSDFADIIESSAIRLEEKSRDKIRFKAQIRFVDTSKLSINDNILKASKRKYAYQWMKDDNTLIIRWDNAFHHPDLNNFPHHKHAENNENVHSSEEMDLQRVLVHIAEQLR